MLKNYLLISVRSLWKNRVYSVINVFGLAVGLTAAVLLMLWVQDERSYDGFHVQADRIYRQTSTFNQEGQQQTWTGVPAATMAFAEGWNVSKAEERNYPLSSFPRALSFSPFLCLSRDEKSASLLKRTSQNTDLISINYNTSLMLDLNWNPICICEEFS